MRQKIGNYYIDSSDFVELVTRFIQDYNGVGLEETNAYRLVPQCAILNFIRKEYECSYPWALYKLRHLINMRRDMEIIRNKRPRGKVFHTPYILVYVKVAKRLSR